MTKPTKASFSVTRWASGVTRRLASFSSGTGAEQEIGLAPGRDQRDAEQLQDPGRAAAGKVRADAALRTAPEVVGEEHYAVAREVQRVLQRYKDLQDIIAILGIDELSEEDRILVGRARRIQRFLSQNTFVAKVFTGIDGSFVPLSETIEAFEALADGKYDHVPEQAFFMCGGLADVEAKAAELAKA